MLCERTREENAKIAYVVEDVNITVGGSQETRRPFYKSVWTLSELYTFLKSEKYAEEHL